MKVNYWDMAAKTEKTIEHVKTVSYVKDVIYGVYAKIETVSGSIFEVKNFSWITVKTR